MARKNPISHGWERCKAAARTPRTALFNMGRISGSTEPQARPGSSNSAPRASLLIPRATTCNLKCHDTQYDGGAPTATQRRSRPRPRSTGRKMRVARQGMGGWGACCSCCSGVAHPSSLLQSCLPADVHDESILMNCRLDSGFSQPE